MHGEQRDQAEIGAVRRDRQAGDARQATDTQGPADTAEVEDIRLDDVDGTHVDHLPPGRDLAILLAAGDRDTERVRHLFGLFELPIEAWLLEMLDAMVGKHGADLDRPGRREAAIGIDQERGPLAQRLADRRHDFFRPTRPFVDVVAVLGADPELEGIEAVLALEALETLRLLPRSSAPLHGRSIGAKPARRAAKQLDDRLAGFLAAAVPDRRIEAAQ